MLRLQVHNFPMSSSSARWLWTTVWDERDGLSTLMDKINQRAEIFGYEPINDMALDPESRDQWYFEDDTKSRKEKEQVFYDIKREARKLISSHDFDLFFKTRKRYLDQINELMENFDDYDENVREIFKQQFLLPGEYFKGPGWTVHPQAEHPSRLTNRVLAQRWERVERSMKANREQKVTEKKQNANSLAFSDCFDATCWNFTK